MSKLEEIRKEWDEDGMIDGDNKEYLLLIAEAASKVRVDMGVAERFTAIRELRRVIEEG